MTKNLRRHKPKLIDNTKFKEGGGLGDMSRGGGHRQKFVILMVRKKELLAGLEICPLSPLPAYGPELCNTYYIFLCSRSDHLSPRSRWQELAQMIVSDIRTQKSRKVDRKQFGKKVVTFCTYGGYCKT